ncbi:MAG: FecR domain-containing protein [Alphaproteobacteria bacterium]|nr:FecR domain-containing protein [Alphaproteobacteria bacterium]
MTRLKSREVDRQAAEWAAKVDSGPLSPDQQASLDGWLEADIRHFGAFAKARAVLAFADRAKAFGPSFDAASFEPFVQPNASTRWMSRRRFALSGAIAAGVATTIFAVPQAWRAFHVRSYETRIGETRIVPLDDGSIVTLNTDSRMEVKYTEEKRGITLVKGEALFDVAKNKLRPFIVDAAGATVRAVGTSFSVTLLPNRPIQVLVREGEVEIKRPEILGGAPVRLSANSRAVAPPDAPIETIPVTRVEVSRELLWRVGRLSFEGETLESAAATFARYSSIRIEIDDPVLAKETVTGVFVSNDPIGFSKAVALSLGLRADVNDDAVKISR